jgi:hypothetical protein
MVQPLQNRKASRNVALGKTSSDENRGAARYRILCENKARLAKLQAKV